MSANYDELRRKLLEVNEDPQTYTFDEIVEIIGDDISPVYINRRTFKHSSSAFQKKAREAGFVITDVDYVGQTLTFRRNNGAAATGAGTTSRRRARPSLSYNADLPSTVTKDARGAVEITLNNWSDINAAIYLSPAYEYVCLFARDALLNTKPVSPKDISLGQIITRLVIINQIDSVNLSKDIGIFTILANSILEEGIEEEISKNLPISNEKFRRIAKRRSAIPGGRGKCYFSAITKYISRSAQFVYEYCDGYPIFDGVLEKHLPLYIPSMNPTSLKQNCDYEGYCKAINDYLTNLNSTLPKADRINNIMFDQIVWFSYKTTSKRPKYI